MLNRLFHCFYIALLVALTFSQPAIAAGFTWGTEELIEAGSAGDARRPQVTFDPSGNAIAVWDQSDGTRYNIWSNRYTAGSGWGTAELIETDNAGSAYSPQVVIDSSGSAIVVWYQSDGTRHNIWSNRYTSGSGWGTSGLIETDNAGSAYFPQVSINSSGNAIAVWQQSDGTLYNIYSNRYTAGSGWGTAELVETDNAGSASSPQVAIDSSGSAIAVWYQDDGTLNNIWSNRYTAGSGWGTAELIETDNAGSAYSPQVAIDSSGSAIAVWLQYNVRNNIYSNRYSASSGTWGTAELIETGDAGHASNPQVTIDPSGNAIAVWDQSDGVRTNAWSNRYTSGTGWGTAELIETGSGNVAEPQVAIDLFSNAIAVWSQVGGARNNIVANKLTATGAWIGMYRAYNPNADFHFFTTSFVEFASAVSAGYTDETSVPGFPFYVMDILVSGTSGIYRLYNPNNGRHYYTASEGEKNYLVGLGWLWQSSRIEGYIYTSLVSGTTEVFKLYNNNSGVHLYTASVTEKDTILAAFPGIWVLNTSLGYASTSP